MGLSGDTDSTASRMRLIETEFITPRRTGDPLGRRATTSAPAAPVNLGILDHMAASVNEVVDFTRAAAPDAGPPPAKASAVYAWMADHAEHLAEEKRRDAEVLVLRQGLEHAAAMGEEDTVRHFARRQPCPNCRCYGLFWRPTPRLAACVNRKCPGPGRPARTFTLAQLARHHVEARESLARRAT